MTQQFLLEKISGKSIVLNPTDGLPLVHFDGVFDKIDEYFHNKGNHQEKPTEKMLVDVYRLVKDANYGEIFCSLSNDYSSLCFTQAQVASFVRDHPEWLPKDATSNFLLRLGNYLIVAEVFSAGSRIIKYQFESLCILLASCRPQIVVPSL